jgi:hypothetical protein
VANFLPGLVVRELLVRKTSEAEAGVGNPNAAAIVSHDLSSDVDQGPLFGLDHCTGLVSAVDQDETPYTAVCITPHQP